MEIIGTGLSGLVGSRITSLLSSEFTFTDLSKETGVDLMDFSTVEQMINKSLAPWVFHFAAYTNVQGAELEKEKGKESVSWGVNVLATENIVNICKQTGKRLLYISTDYVFDGEKDEYNENDQPHPISWYGITKYEGEKFVQTLENNALIVRIANPYRSNPVGKMDFVHKMLERIVLNEEIRAPSDQIFCPTFIDDLGVSLARLVLSNAYGIFHVGSDTGITPYEAANTVANEFGYPNALIVKTSYDQYFMGKAMPPKQAVLKHDKINASGITLHSFEQGVHIVKQQEKKGA